MNSRVDDSSIDVGDKESAVVLQGVYVALTTLH